MRIIALRFRRESRNSGGADNKADPCARQQEDAIVPSDNPVCRTTKWILRVHEKYSPAAAIVLRVQSQSHASTYGF